MVTRTFTVSVTPVNDPPTLIAIADPLAILEDAAQQTISLTGISAGPAETQTLTVTATSSNPGLIPDPIVTYASPNSSAALSYTPVANQFGTATITVTVHDDGGTAGGGVDIVTRTFTVSVTPVNDPPSFDHMVGSYSATDEDPQTHGPAPRQTIPGWANRIAAGPANESAQQLSFVVNVNNTALFLNDGQPAISSDGTLSYTPAPNAHGIANVTVLLEDDGGGNNTSQIASFQIEIVKAHPLHNASEIGSRNGLDVTGSTSAQPDGFIVGGDAVAVINYINAKGSGHISDSSAYGPPYCDVNGDDNVVAEDVLKIINYINANPIQSEGEGESSAAGQLEANGVPNDLISLLAFDLAEQVTRRRRLR
jgi:hypothetical protein